MLYEFFGCAFLGLVIVADHALPVLTAIFWLVPGYPVGRRNGIWVPGCHDNR